MDETIVLVCSAGWRDGQCPDADTDADANVDNSSGCCNI